MKFALFSLAAGAAAFSGRAGRTAVRMASQPLAQSTGFANMDQSVLGKYMALSLGDNVQCERVPAASSTPSQRKRRRSERGILSTRGARPRPPALWEPPRRFKKESHPFPR